MRFDELAEPWQAIDPALWDTGGTVAIDSPGVLSIRATFAGVTRSWVQTDAQYELTGSELVVDLIDGPAPAGATYASATLYTGTAPATDPALVIEVARGPQGDVIRFGYRPTSGALRQWLVQRPYSPAVHRFWRFGEAGGSAVFAVSPDLIDWTELSTWPVPFSLGALRLRLESYQSADIDEETPPGGDSLWGPLNPEAFVLEAGDPFTLVATDTGAPSIAIDVLPDSTEAGSFLVGDPATPGDGSEVDGDDLLAWGTASGLWVNVVCDVTRLAVRRGATRSQGVLTRTEAGTVELELLDTARRFDPTVNAGAIHPGTPLRVRLWGTLGDESGWSEVIGTGRISGEPGEFTVQYRQTGAPVVTLTAVDVVGRLARYASAGTPGGVGAGDNLRSRIERVLAETGTPADTLGYDVDVVYAATLAANELGEAWQPILDAADAELGRVWVTRYDRLIARARGSELSGPVRLTLSDWHGEAVEATPHCCYSEASVGVGTELLANRAVGARTPAGPGDEPVVAQVDDTVSQARYSGGIATTVDRRDLELETDAQVADWCGWIVGHYAEPELRVDSVTLAPWNAPEAWPAVAALDVGDRAAFRLHPQIGPTVVRTLGVLGIVHEATPEGWSVVITTIDAPTPTEGNPSGWFMIGDPGDPDDGSEVDGGDLLWPVGPVPEFVLPTY